MSDRSKELESRRLELISRHEDKIDDAMVEMNDELTAEEKVRAFRKVVRNAQYYLSDAVEEIRIELANAKARKDLGVGEKS